LNKISSETNNPSTQPTAATPKSAALIKVAVISGTVEYPPIVSR